MLFGRYHHLRELLISHPSFQHHFNSINTYFPPPTPICHSTLHSMMHQSHLLLDHFHLTASLLFLPSTQPHPPFSFSCPFPFHPFTQHNFQIGADYSKEYNAGQYETDYNSGYGAVPKAAYMEAHSHKGSSNTP